MASLVHFEEKVHRKKLQRADTIPLLFLRLFCQILEHMGFPTEPRLECRRLCRKRFTLDKWNQLVDYSAPLGVPPMVAPPVPPQPEQGELPTETIPPVPRPEATSAAPPMTHTVPPISPTTSKSSITISASEFRSLIHVFRHSPPHMLLSSSRWLRCVPIRTSRLLYSARFSITWDFCLHLSLTFLHHQSL